jgi:hypothetical protein
MRTKPILGGVAAVALFASSALATDTFPLPAGKPAGVQRAALLGTTLGLLVSLGTAALGIAYVVGAFNKSKSTSTTGTSS